MYQKSPFPYLFILVVIIGMSCFTSLTIDKEIEQPIVHVIQQNNIENEMALEKKLIILKDSPQIASIE